MHIITGAAGQVGSGVIAQLLQDGEKVKGIVHSDEKAAKLKEQGAEAAVADVFDLSALKLAFKDGDTAFLITPETGKSEDLIAETTSLLNNYREAIAGSGIKKIVGLSSIGAHLGKGTGNLEMSYLLEHAFEGLPVRQVFIRPAYYFSNWLMGIDQVKETGILPTFYPADQRISMISPQDVAQLAAELLSNDKEDNNTIYELLGPAELSSADVAAVLSLVLNKPIHAQQIPRDQWEANLQKQGWTPDGVKNFIKMTDLVVAGKTAIQGGDTITRQADTTLQQFLEKALKQ